MMMVSLIGVVAYVAIAMVAVVVGSAASLVEVVTAFLIFPQRPALTHGM